MERSSSKTAVSGEPSSAGDVIDGKAKFINPELVESMVKGAVALAILAGLVTAADEVTWFPGCPCK